MNIVSVLLAAWASGGHHYHIVTLSLLGWVSLSKSKSKEFGGGGVRHGYRQCHDY
jgi:hypothetical protein